MKINFGMVGILGLVCLAFASGCGSSNGGGAPAGYKSKDQGGTGKECSDQLGQDIQTLNQSVNAPGATADQDKQLIQAFRTKYQDVVCTYVDNGHTGTLDVDKLTDEWLAKLNGGGAAPTPQGHGGF